MEGQREGIADLEEEVCTEEHHGSADVAGHHLIVEHPMVGEQNEPNAGLPRPSGVGTHDSRERRNLGHQLEVEDRQELHQKGPYRPRE